MKDKKQFFYIDNITNFSVGITLLVCSLVIITLIIDSGNPNFSRALLGLSILSFVISIFFLNTVNRVSIKKGYLKSKGKKRDLSSIKFLAIEKSIYKMAHVQSHNDYTFHKFTLYTVSTYGDSLHEHKEEIISVKSLKKVLEVAKAVMKNSSLKIRISHSQFKLHLTYDQLISSWINKLKDENILELDSGDESDSKDFLFTTNQDNIKSENPCQDVNHLYVKKDECEKTILYYQKTKTEENRRALIITAVIMFLSILFISMPTGTYFLYLIFLILMIPLVIYIKVTKDNITKWVDIVFKDNKIKFANYDPVEAEDIYYIHKSANDNSLYEIHLKDGSVIKLQPYSKIATTLFCQLNRELNDIS